MTIPFGLNEEIFERRFRGVLDRCSSDLIDEFRRVIATAVSEQAEKGCLEIFLDERGEAGPTINLSFEGANHSHLPELDISIFKKLAEIEVFDERYFEDEDFGALYIQAETLKAWVSECWWKAGGWDYPIFIELSIHEEHGEGDFVKLSTGNR